MNFFLKRYLHEYQQVNSMDFESFLESTVKLAILLGRIQNMKESSKFDKGSLAFVNIVLSELLEHAIKECQDCAGVLKKKVGEE